MIARQFKAGFNDHFTIMILLKQKTSRKRLVLIIILVGTRGFEPPTPDTPLQRRLI